MRPNKDRRTEIILYGLLLIPLLFAAAALAQATEQAQGLAEITAVLSEILHTPSMLRWCASTPKFLLAVLVFYPLAVYCYMLDQADRHPGAEHGTAKWGSAHRLNIKYRNTKDPKENYILTENVRFSTDSHAHKHNRNRRIWQRQDTLLCEAQRAATDWLISISGPQGGVDTHPRQNHGSKRYSCDRA